MDEFSRFSQLVLMIQEAALAPERWDDAVSAIVREVDAADGTLFTQSVPPSLGGFWASRSIQPIHVENYAKYYHDKDSWMLAMSKEQASTAGFVFIGDALVDSSVLRRTEFYADFLKHIDLGRLLCGIVMPHGGRSVPGVHLSLFRPLGKSAFNDKQRDFVKRLMPHLQAGLMTHYALNARKSESALGNAALNAIPTAILIVNRTAEVLFANEAARAIFSAMDGLITQKQVLAGVTSHETDSLRAFVARLFDSTAPHSGALMHKIKKPSRRRPYLCFGQPLPAGSALNDRSGQPAAIVFIRDSETGPVLEPESLKQLYGFTVAEAQLAASLARGLSLEEAAAERSTSYETVRTQLKSMFLKTECSRQAELVALLVGSVRL